MPITIPDLPNNTSNIAKRWYHAATNEDDEIAAFQLGLCCFDDQRSKRHKLPLDNRVGLAWMRCAAALGHLQASTFVAACYLFGRGTKANAKKALQWYDEAADSKDPEALSSMGWYYEHGSLDASTPNKGKQDLHKAHQCFYEAAAYSSTSGPRNYKELLQSFRQRKDHFIIDMNERRKLNE